MKEKILNKEKPRNLRGYFTISRTWQIAQHYNQLADSISYIEKTYVNKTEFEKLQVKMDYISENIGEIKQDLKELKQSFIPHK